jgi:choline-sulfatase
MNIIVAFLWVLRTRARIALFLFGASICAGAVRPNIVFILTDDQAPWAFGAAGNAQAKTPNMDRIAREGVRFPNAFTPTPVCSPARASILTSRYGTEVGITDWINPKRDVGVGLDPGIVTWPRLLREAGYGTALFGKWHLGNEDRYHPTNYGYQTFVGFRGGGSPSKNPLLEKNGLNAARDGFFVDIVTDEAIDWLKRREPTTPFAVSIHYREPHTPYFPLPDQDWAKFKDLDPSIPNPTLDGLDVEWVRKTTREYLAAVASLDRNIGRILETLESLGVAHNTIVIFTSDHGYNVGHHGVRAKGNALWVLAHAWLPAGTPNVPAKQRPNMFDTSVQIPLAIRWPALIRPGTVLPDTV